MDWNKLNPKELEILIQNESSKLEEIQIALKKISSLFGQFPSAMKSGNKELIVAAKKGILRYLGAVEVSEEMLESFDENFFNEHVLAYKKAFQTKFWKLNSRLKIQRRILSEKNEEKLETFSI